MSNRDVESRWNDDRLRSAYRDLVGDRPAPEATTTPAAAMERRGVGRGVSGRRHPFILFAGMAATLIILCVIGAAAIVRPGPDTRGSQAPNRAAASTATVGSQTPTANRSSAPSAMTVSEALIASKAQGVTSTDLFTVKGWLQPLASLPAVPCPTFTEDYAFGLGQGDICGASWLPISESEDGQGVNVRIAILPGTSLPDSVRQAPGHAVEIVVVFHVHDLRSSLCSSKAECEAVPVLDQVAWFEGRAFGPSVSVFTANVKPSLTVEQVREAVGKVLQPGSTIVSMTAAKLVDAFESFSPGLAPSGDGEAVEWYVRVFGPPATLFPMPGSHAGSGVLVLEEKSQFSPGGLRGAAGWGWDSAKPGVSMADGTVSIGTTNWLPGGMCAGVGLDAVLRGSRDDPRIAWLEVAPSANNAGFEAPGIVWPAGYRARFSPGLEIVDASGAVVLQDGDPVGGACVISSDANAPLLLEPPFN